MASNNLYLISHDDKKILGGEEFYYSAIVCAPNEEIARLIHPSMSLIEGTDEEELEDYSAWLLKQDPNYVKPDYVQDYYENEEYEPSYLNEQEAYYRINTWPLPEFVKGQYIGVADGNLRVGVVLASAHNFESG